MATAPLAPATPDWTDWLGSPLVRRTLQRLLDEHRQAAHLASHGLWPRSRILLIGPPDCGQGLIVDRLAERLGQSPQVLSLEAWATVPPADQWAALDAWAAAGSYLVVRHADGLSAASAGLATDAVTRRFLAWCGTACMSCGMSPRAPWPARCWIGFPIG